MPRATQAQLQNSEVFMDRVIEPILLLCLLGSEKVILNPILNLILTLRKGNLSAAGHREQTRN